MRKNWANGVPFSTSKLGFDNNLVQLNDINFKVIHFNCSL